MRILVVGSGGREHTFVWKLANSPQISELFCAPGNAGISDVATCVEIQPSEIEALANFAMESSIDLTVVGPELPLSLGIADLFEERGLRLFGPKREAAKLEASKAFAKELMAKYSIPTAQFRIFSSYQRASKYASSEAIFPLFIKASGLAAGKGAILVSKKEEALQCLDLMMREKRFGEAGEIVVIEEYLRGREASFHALCDGEIARPLATSQDHKSAYDGAEGPNTGGMGAFSPTSSLDADDRRRIMKSIIEPTVAALQEEGREFRGVLYAGLMLTEEGPKVLEFNVRMGDPECQVILPRLQSDIIPLLDAVIDGNLGDSEIEWTKHSAVCVVLTAGGYPGPYDKGKVISGLGTLEEDILVFHAGTTRREDMILTAGGRVLGITALGHDVHDAAKRAYHAIDTISFDAMHYRTDIGADVGDRGTHEKANCHHHREQL